MARLKEFTISVAIRAIDKISEPMSRMNRAFEKMSGSLRRARAVSAPGSSPFLRFQSETRALSRGISEFSSAMGLTRVYQNVSSIGGKLSQTFGSIKNAFGGMISFFMKGSILLGIAGFSFYEALGGYIKRTDGLDRVSKAFGMSTEAMMAWGFAAEAAGLEADSLHKIMRKLAGSQALAAWGVPTDSLNLYNLGVKSLKSGGKLRGVDSLLFDISKRVSNPNLDQQKKIALLRPVFGKQAYDALTMLGAGPEALKSRMTEMKAISFRPDDEAKKRGHALRYAQLRAKAAFAGMSDTIMNELAPGLERFFNKFTEFWKENRKEITKWAHELSERLPGAFDALKDTLSTISGFFSPIVSALKALIETFGAGRTVIGLFLAYFSIQNTQLIFGLSQSIWNFGKSAVFLYSSLGGLVGIFDALCGILFAFAPEIAGLVLLAGIGYEVYHHWDKVKEVFNSIAETFEKLKENPIAKFLWNTSIPGILYNIMNRIQLDSNGSDTLVNQSKETDFIPNTNSSSLNGESEINDLIRGIGTKEQVESNSNDISKDYFKAIRNQTPQKSKDEHLGQIVVEFINTPAGTRISHRNGSISLNVKQGRSFLEVPA